MGDPVGICWALILNFKDIVGAGSSLCKRLMRIINACIYKKSEIMPPYPGKISMLIFAKGYKKEKTGG